VFGGFAIVNAAIAISVFLLYRSVDANVTEFAAWPPLAALGLRLAWQAEVWQTMNYPFPGETPMSIRILIADDDPNIRLLLRRLLEKQQDWHVCGEASNGIEASNE
jgi:hypothetical protein